MSAAKEVNDLIRRVKKQGFRVENIKNGWQVYEKDGDRIVTLHKTPSHSAMRHYVSDLRKLGYKD